MDVFIFLYYYSFFFFLNFLCFLLFLTFVVYWNDVPIAPPSPPGGGGKGAWTQKSLCPNLEMGEELKGRGEQVGEVRKGEGWVQSWFHPGGTPFNRLRGFPAASSRQQRCDPPPPPNSETIHPRESESGPQVLVVWSGCSASTTVSTLCCSECNHGNELRCWNRPLRMKTIIKKKMLIGETFVSTKAQISF